MQLFATPSAGFDHPLEMIDGCHDRIRSFCARAMMLANHLELGGADEQCRQAAREILRYFETAAANHHRDEEEDLFPALQHHAPSAELNAVRALLFRLRSDHARLDRHWQEMRLRLQSVARGDGGALPLEVAEAFAAAYESHIEFEERELLPLARRVLDLHVIRHLGCSMARRRGVTQFTA